MSSRLALFLLMFYPCWAVCCGTVLSISTSESTTRFVHQLPTQPEKNPITLVLLPGGSGHVDLDVQGCAQELTGNSLVRMLPLFHAAGLATALVDAPSDHQGEEGLAGFRNTRRHAADLGKIINELRARSNGEVWIVGTSRGSISAVNAASRLTGAAAPDGVVLTSALMSGQTSAKKPWVTQTVFDLPLENLRQPLLILGHAADACSRSPANLMPSISARSNSVRQQVVLVQNGTSAGAPNLHACVGQSAHGFLYQEAEVAAGIARFVRGGVY